MAYRVFQFGSLIPAGTPQATPVTVPISLDNWSLESIDLEVPPGPAGLMGFYVANNGVPWIPNDTGDFLVWDDVIQSWAFEDQPNASGWAIVGFNTGTYDHTVISRWHVNTPTADQQTNGFPQLTVVTSNVPTVPIVTL